MTGALIAIGLYLVIGLAFAIVDASYGYGFLSWLDVVGIVLVWPIVAFIFFSVVWRAWHTRRRRPRPPSDRSEQ